MFISYSGNTSSPDVILAHAALDGEIEHSLEHAPGDFGHKILKLVITRDSSCPKEPRFTRWNLRKAKWDLFSKLSDQEIKEDLIQGSVDAAFNNICTAVLKCATQAIPRGCVKRYSPFWNEDLQRLKEERNIARTAYEQSRLQEDKIRLKEAGALLRKEIINAKRNSYNQFLENLDFRKDGVQAHRFLSKISKNMEPAKRQPFVASSGKTLTSNEDIAKLFCSYYAKISSWQPEQKNRKLNLKLPPTCLNEKENSLFHTPFCWAELEIALDTMPIKKCAGPDNIPPEFIKHLGGSARSTLLRFMNKVWEQGIPSVWRKADILPIPKKGKPTNRPENCRPIALTSMFSKLYERLLHSFPLNPG